MKRIAITGGIGSGKSYVCRLLAKRGIQVYDCDAAAKRLMRTDAVLQHQLCDLVGADVYQGHDLQKKVLARFLLASEANQQAVDGIVHPAVARDFEQSGYTWLESAILFDSGFDRRVSFDAFVFVDAPLDVRLKRIMDRDHICQEKAMQWIASQLPAEEVRRRCDFTIENDGRTDLESQIDMLLRSLGALVEDTMKK